MGPEIMYKMTQIPARRICCCGRNMPIHTDYRNHVEERDGEATVSRGECL